MMSLRLRLLLIIGLSLSVLWGVMAVWMFLGMRQELRAALDDRLAASARMVAGLVSHMPTHDGLPDERKVSPLDVIARDGLACEVSLLRGEVLTRTVARTVNSPGLASAAWGYGIHTYGGKPWRTYVLVQGGIRIATADRIDLRETLLRDMALSAGLPFMAALVGSSLLLWFGIGRGLAPIERVRVVLAQRRPDDEMPLPKTEAPPELRPLVDTIQGLLERVRGAITRERRFTNDAAHELRTPLTAIKTHVQVALLAAGKPGTAGVMAQALSDADQGVQRLQATLDQLLLLARLDASAEQAPASAWGMAGAAVQQALGGLSAAHHAKERIVFHEDVAVCATQVAVPQALLASALRNLLDNALRYSPADGQVLLRVAPQGQDCLCFSVLDEGPGLTPAACTQAVQRFWRGEARGTGSGLGLSIVTAIADGFGGTLTLNPGAHGGLEARLTMPVGPHPLSSSG